MQHAAATPPEWLASWAPQWVLDVAAVPPMIDHMPHWLVGILIVCDLFHVRGYAMKGIAMMRLSRAEGALLPPFMFLFGLFVFLCCLTHLACASVMMLLGGLWWFIALPIFIASAAVTEHTLREARRHWPDVRPRLVEGG